MIYFSPTYINICIFGISLLSIASLANFALVKLKPGNVTFAKVTVIIRSWWLIIGILLLASLFGAMGFLVLFSLINILIIREYLKNTRLQYARRVLSQFMYLSLFAQILLLYFGFFTVFYAFPVLFFIVSFPLLLTNPQNIENIDKLTASYLCVLLLTHALFYLPALIIVGPEFLGNFDKTLILFFLVFGLTSGNDVFQFICGKAFGKRKLIPHLSPNKTEAGFIGGILTTTLVGSLLFLHWMNLSWTLGIVFALTISILGIFGDLTFSGIKRYFQIKDFSDSLPGHGGYIDRVDSLIFTSPVLFHIITFSMGA